MALGSRQQRALLAVLVCNTGHVVSRGTVVDALWGDSPPPGAAASIQTHISHLRQTLEPDRARGAAPTVIVTHETGYRLTIPVGAIDATRFEIRVAEAAAHLHEGQPASALAGFDAALSLWRGDVLGDLTGYAFVVPVAAGLNELRTSAREERVQALLDLRRDSAALGELDRLLALHPLREGLHAQRMLALYRTGRQSEALDAYRQLRVRLGDQLGLEPSPALQDLQHRILRHDSSLTGGPTTTELPPAARDETPLSPESAATGVPGAPVTSPHHVARRDSGSRARRALVALLACVALALTLVRADATVDPPRVIGGNTIGIVDASGQVMGAVAAGTNPVMPAYGGGAIWVASQSEGTVVRIDPATATITQRFEVGHNPSAIVATEQYVWVANSGDGTVTQINIGANRVVQEAIRVGTQPTAMSVGGGGVWVANSGDNTVQRLDERTGQPAAPVDVGDGPDGVLVDGRDLWVANGRDGTVSHLDATTGVELFSPIQVGAGARGLARVGDELWVTDELSQSVSRIDIADRQVRPIYVGDGPTSLTVLEDAVWLTEKDAARITRIDSTTERLTSIPVGGSPQGVIAAEGRLWVAVAGAAPETHRGGTLTVAAAALPGSGPANLDPAQVYAILTSWPERLVYQGLVALRYSGQDSYALVPNLATRLPRPSDGGRTYTFQIRRGVRYSTGAEVKANDFVRGVIRAVTTGPAPLYSGIVGAPDCREHPTECDRLDGVEADDVTGRLTFHLTTPDPDLLYKLTLLVFPTPPESPVAPQTIPPGTGPYLVSDYLKDYRFELARNPYFSEPWSVAAVPTGYPDAIRWLKVDDVRAGVEAVDAGQADLVELTPLTDRSQTHTLVDDLLIRDPRQLHTGAVVGTTFVALNSSIPPFDSVQARQAVNYAVDRGRLVELSGGPSAAAPTCQLSLPGFPGHAPYCPYTTGAEDGRYHGPDLDTARRLIAESGTAGARVTVTDIVGDYSPAYDDYIGQVLRELGYQVTMEHLDNTDENQAHFSDPDSGIQVQSGGWLPDYPRPSTFYDALVRCPTELIPQAYVFGYCDPQTDLAADAALALQATDPGRALRAWANVQHTVTDKAPVVFGVTTRDVWYSSDRVGNYQQAEIYGPLFSQLWVR